MKCNVRSQLGTGPAVPATWGDGSVGVVDLVGADGGQDLSFQVPYVDAGV